MTSSGSASPPGSGGPLSRTPTRGMSVTDLELAFAQNPESDAYRALCEAYLQQGRFMEAMVVCKKGLKAHPDALDAHLLLVRVYAEQKKYPRALQEIELIFNKHASSAAIWLTRGRIKLLSNDKTGTQDLLEALKINPALEEAKTLLTEHGVALPTVAPPAPVMPLPPPGAVMSHAQPVPVTSTPGVANAPGVVVTANRSSPPPVPRQAMPAQYAPTTTEELLESMAQQTAFEPPERGSAKTFMRILVVGLVAVIIAAVSLYRYKTRLEAMDQLTKEGTRAFELDTYGGYKKALERFKTILDNHDENHDLTLGRIAHTYVILWGEHGESSLKPEMDEILARAAKHAPKVSHTLAAQALAMLYGATDKAQAARSARELLLPQLEAVKAKGGTAPPALMTLGIAELELGQYDEALAKLDEVRRMTRSARAQLWFGRAALRAGRYKPAENAFRDTLKLAPDHPAARAGLAQARIARGAVNAAANDLLAFDAYVQKNPKDVSLRDAALAEYVRSEIFRTANETAKAEGAYERAVQMDPRNPDFPFGLGRWLLEQQRAKDALPYFEQALKLENTRPTFLIELAEAQMQLDDYKSADANIAKAETRAPTSVDVALARARYLRRKQPERAESYLNNLLEKHPSAKPKVQMELGRLYRAQNKLAEATQVLENAIQNMTNLSSAEQGEILLSYARLMEDKGELVTATNTLRQATKLDVVEAWYRLAKLLSQSGSGAQAEAKQACERYLSAGANLRYTAAAQDFCSRL